MQLRHPYAFVILYVRIALAVPYLWFVSDRLGMLGAHGQPHIGWGDWQHFMEYARDTMRFLPEGMVPFFAITATACEFVFGVLLLIGLFTRFAAIGSGVLSLLFAISMAISFGIESPLGYSVFAVSAASFLLAAVVPRRNFPEISLPSKGKTYSIEQLFRE